MPTVHQRASVVGPFWLGFVRVAVAVSWVGCATPPAEEGGSDTTVVDAGEGPDAPNGDGAAGPPDGAECAVDLDCKGDDPCVVARRCVEFSCTSGVDVCKCREDKDCDTADRCLGRPFCDKAKAPYRCGIDTSAAIACDTSKDTACRTTACAPTDGSCTTLNALHGTPCEDGDACSQHDGCDSGACKAGASICPCAADADCAAKDDGDPCNGTLGCDKGNWPWTCAPKPGTAPSCPDDGPCTVNACDKASGGCKKTAANDGAACDDGDKCTIKESCAGGACTGGQDTCSCTKDADCLALDDGDLCNGVPTCEKSGKSGSCAPAKASATTCPGDGDGPCVKNACRPDTGICVPTIVSKLIKACATDKSGGQACVWLLAKPGQSTGAPAPCDDGDPCTVGTTCSNGGCSGGNNTCGCQHDADCKTPDACAGAGFCNQQTKECEVAPASIITCPSGGDTDCVKNACDPASGQCELSLAIAATPVCAAEGGVCRWVKLAAAKKSQPCSDGDACTTGEHCKGAACVGGKKDLAAGGCGCSQDADCNKGGAVDKCAGTAFCNKATKTCAVNEAAAITCKTVDDTACLKAACDPADGSCALAPIEKSAPVCLPGQASQTCRRVLRQSPASGASFCEDGDPCTKGDLCAAGKCVSGAVTCACTTDADCAATDDGDLCNGTMFCDKSDTKVPDCKLDPLSKVTCPALADTACVLAACDPSTGKCGKIGKKDGSTCDAGSLCTTGDACVSGGCKGASLSCDDQTACTLDSCLPAVGCLHATKTCADANDCTVDSCDAKTGACRFDSDLAQGNACNADGNPCTINDSCKLGACVIGEPLKCQDDGNPCTIGHCQPATGGGTSCQTTQLNDATPCDHDGLCTRGNTCKGGKCAGGTKQRLWKVLFDNPGGTGTAVAKLPNKRVMAALVVPDTSSKSAAVVVMSETGTFLSFKFLKSGLTSDDDGVNAALATGDGALLLQRETRDNKLVAQVAPLTVDSKNGIAVGKGVAWLLPTGSLGQQTRGLALGTDAGGALVAAGEELYAAQTTVLHYPRLWRWTATGTATDVQPLVVPGVTTVRGRMRIVVPAPSGFYATGAWWVGKASQAVGRITRFTGNTLAWRRDIGNGEVSAAVSVGPEGTDDGVLVGLRRDADGYSFLQRISGGGKPLWRSLVGAGRLQGLTKLAPHMFLMRAATVVSPPSSAIVRIDSVGAEHGTHVMDSFGMLLRATPHGRGILAAGFEHHQGLKANRPIVAVLDAFGRETCATSGTCFAKTADGCADGNPCTRDTCNAATGCSNPLELSLPCADGSACVFRGFCDAAASCAVSDALLHERGTTGAGGVKGLWLHRGLQPRLLTRAFANTNYAMLDLSASGEIMGDGLSWISGEVLRADGGRDRRVILERLDGKVALRPQRPDLVHGSFLTFPLCAKASECTPAALRWAELGGGGGALTVHFSGSFRATAHVTGVAVEDVQSFDSFSYKKVLDVQLAAPKLGWRHAGLSSVAKGGKGPLVIAAAISGASATHGLHTRVVALDASGKSMWSWDDSTPGFIEVAVAQANGGARVARATGGKVTPTSQVAFTALSSTGKMIAHKTLPALGKRHVSGIAGRSDGSWMVGGWGTIDAAHRMWLAAVEDKGELQWQRGYSALPLDVTTENGGPLLEPDGRTTLVASSPWPGSNSKIVVLRTDPWGRSSCSAAGACALKTAGACDDKDPCTSDLCHPSGGCSHAAIPGCKGASKP